MGSERVTIALGQGTSESPNFEAKPTQQVQSLLGRVSLFLFSSVVAIYMGSCLGGSIGAIMGACAILTASLFYQSFQEEEGDFWPEYQKTIDGLKALKV